MRRFLPFALSLAASCQPLPHPFADNVPPLQSAILKPRDSAGIFVLSVRDAPSPIAAHLAEAMAAALRDAEIPASAQGRNRGSYLLLATASERPLEDGRLEVVIDWELRTADGTPLGRVAGRGQPRPAAWLAGDEAVAQALAAPAAPAIAKLVQDEPPKIAADADPMLALRPVTGAPGDGERSLTRAMDSALRRAHIALADKPSDRESFVLTGTVKLSPPQGGKQQVQVHWALLDPNGRQIGQVSQENAVPAGSLDVAWGDIAYAVADAAAPGIAALVERAKAAKIGS
jgi:hypothetical protein